MTTQTIEVLTGEAASKRMGAFRGIVVHFSILSQNTQSAIQRQLIIHEQVREFVGNDYELKRDNRVKEPVYFIKHSEPVFIIVNLVK